MAGGAERADLRRAFAHLSPRAGPPPVDAIAAMRLFVDRYGDVDPRPPLRGVTVTPVTINSVVAEWLVPPDADYGVRTVYLHGGGWVAGGLGSHRPLAAALAKMSRSCVLLLDYRLAPEHPFPAGLDDAIAAVAWAADHGPQGAAPATLLCLVGDSAGGNLAAATCLEALDHDRRLPDRLTLICAPLDVNADIARGDRADVIAGSAEIKALMALYVQSACALDDHRLSPLNAPTNRLACFPPTLLQVSGAEFLLWDSRVFSDALIDAGAQVVLSVWPHMPHVWHAFLSLLPESSAALREIAAFLRCGEEGFA